VKEEKRKGRSEGEEVKRGEEEEKEDYFDQQIYGLLL
jgi:hypothetical protein